MPKIIGDKKYDYFCSMKVKKKKTLPIQNKCRNCGTQLISRFCHNCGQDLFAGRERTVIEIAYNTVETAFAFDNKIIRTLKFLLCYPGKLTKEFFEGKIVHYVYPAKLFWFTSLIFFATSINNDRIQIKEPIIQEVTKPSVALTHTDVTEPWEETKSTFSKSRHIWEKHKEIDRKKFSDIIHTYIPYLMFILIPFFALLLQLFFYKKKKYYANQVIFALHFHAFAFLLFSLCSIIGRLPGTTDMLTSIKVWIPAIYFTIALYMVYRPSIRGMLWKIPCIMLLYGIGIITVLLLYSILALSFTIGFQDTLGLIL